MPLLRGRNANSVRSQRWEMTGFWIMVISMMGITLALTGAGLVTMFTQRMGANPSSFMEVAEASRPFFWIRELAGVGFLLGLLAYLISFFVPGEYGYEAEVKKAVA